MAETGNEGMAITDHADFTNISWILDNLRKLQDYRDDYELKVLFGVEITHVPPELIGRAVEFARKEGAEIVIVHGETIVEPVKEGTNYSAVQEEVDILAHPGIIDLKAAELASSNGIYLEISARKGHCLANGYVVRVAEETNCNLVVNTDAHSPSDFIDKVMASEILRGSGVNNPDEVLENAKTIMRKRDR
jgi:histidinol phosphatase-like PHP family hydrolase